MTSNLEAVELPKHINSLKHLLADTAAGHEVI